jgi:hypothetical protein
VKVRAKRQHGHDQRSQTDPADAWDAPARHQSGDKQRQQRQPDVRIVLGDVAGEVDEARGQEEGQQVADVDVGPLHVSGDALRPKKLKRERVRCEDREHY